MDPNANLAEQRRIVARVTRGKASDGDLDRLAELVEALDGWLSKGGFLPTAWEQGQQPEECEDNACTGCPWCDGEAGK